MKRRRAAAVFSLQTIKERRPDLIRRRTGYVLLLSLVATLISSIFCNISISTNQNTIALLRHVPILTYFNK